MMNDEEYHRKMRGIADADAERRRLDPAYESTRVEARKIIRHDRMGFGDSVRGHMKLVIIESPYAGDIEANTEYARRCMLHSLECGEAPLASHLLYTQLGILREDVPDERKWGIEAGLEWRRVAEHHVFYVDRGWSRGMFAAFDVCVREGRSTESRSLVTDHLFGVHGHLTVQEAAKCDCY